MVKFGIISDTHIKKNDEPEKISALLEQLRLAFKDVDEIIHAGDVCDEFFLEKLNEIAPTKCVKGNMDKIKDLENFIKFSVGRYSIGVIHELPENVENFAKENNIHILIHGHSHQPLNQGTPYNTLLLNPGSPTKPKPPPQKRGFKKPIARPSVILMEIDENDHLKTYIVNLNLKI
ncbi:MAG: YfcE family phosphodiesterase [Promethearchaeota archaeon]|nr:MAG: YfcE family phosphodiesterase [Candidatus Lokiarchaeota archaeon]